MAVRDRRTVYAPRAHKPVSRSGAKRLDEYLLSRRKPDGQWFRNTGFQEHLNDRVESDERLAVGVFAHQYPRR
jgi:hypothetical protein